VQLGVRSGAETYLGSHGATAAASLLVTQMTREHPSRRLLLVISLVSVLVAATSAAPPALARQIVWVSLEGRGETVKVGVGSRQVLRRFSTPGRPHNVVAADGVVAVALWDSTRIAIIRSGRVHLIRLGGAPHDVKMWRDRIVVANQGGARVQVVRTDGTVLRSVRLRWRPHDLAVNARTGRVWVTLEGTGRLAVFRLGHPDVAVRYVATGQRPHDILFAPDGRLWVTDWDGELHVYAPLGFRHVRSIPLGVEAHHLAFTPNGRAAWITDHGAQALFVLRVSPVRRIDRIPFPGEPHHVAITGRGVVVVADHAHGRLVLYRARTHRRIGAISVGAGPHGVWAP
jgi:DNA-binding beta-propeller fold protein YncE